MKTFGELASQPAPKSFWRRALARVAGDRPLEDYLIEQANLRGFWGAYLAEAPRSGKNPALGSEEIVVGLLAPQSSADARVLKLVTRILQSGQVDEARLLLLARREKAEGVLQWLIRGIPQPERTATIDRLERALAKARSPRAPVLDYSFGRLVKRPATAGDLWSRARRKS